MRYSKRDTDVKNRLLDSCGRRRGWDDVREWHSNMYITVCEIDRQSRFYAWDRALRTGALGWPWGTGWGGRWEGGSGWGTHVHQWLIHVNVWQKPPQYCKVISLQLKKKKKNPSTNSGDPCSIPGAGRSPGEGHGNPLQNSCLGNLMDRGAWQATVYGISKSWTRLSN